MCDRQNTPNVILLPLVYHIHGSFVGQESIDRRISLPMQILIMMIRPVFFISKMHH